MPSRAPGLLQLPYGMRRDLIVLVSAKLCGLAALYWLFFSPSHRPVVDAVAHIAGPLAGR